MQLLNDILKTYEVLISIREKTPGMKMEYAFDEEAMYSIKKEYELLKALKEIIE